MSRDSNVRIRIFIASPSDVSEERNRLSVVVSELRRKYANQKPVNVTVDLLKWEDTHPAVGDTVQQAIDEQIGTYDIFVGLMWKRFGTPTDGAGSGTKHEFDRALASWKSYRHPRILMYFSARKFYPESVAECRQVTQVLQFKKSLRKEGVLFHEVHDALEFERESRTALDETIVSLLRQRGSYAVY